MKVEVDRELCISAASCVAIAPNTFALDEEGIAIVKKQDGDARDTILQAAQSCPVNAIKVFDDDGTQLWPPLAKK